MGYAGRRGEYPVPRRKGPRTVLNVGLMECRWVTNQVTDAGLRVFCGDKTRTSRKPYCDTHYGLVYVRQEKKRDGPSADDPPWRGSNQDE